MLIFTNRAVHNGTDETAFGRIFLPGNTRLAMATVQRAAGTGLGWKVSALRPDIADGEGTAALVPLFQAPRGILVYLHGNDNTPATCFERCALLESFYNLEVVGFSWASEGFLADGNDLPGLQGDGSGDETDLRHVRAGGRTSDGVQRRIRRYHQAKTNAQDSVDALARFLRLLAIARLQAAGQPFSVAAHSLGAHFLQYALDVPGAGESLATAHNVVLLAACVRASGHRDWLAKVRPKGQVFVAYNKSDSVLFGAYIADGAQLKLGTDPGTELLRSPAVRYVSFSNAEVGFAGHRYFVMDGMPGKTHRLFERLFGSARDIEVDEYPRQVYPVGCDADGLTCYMAAPREVDGG
jgi:hypothetical protein